MLGVVKKDNSIINNKNICCFYESISRMTA